jgi:hypothetical protein
MNVNWTHTFGYDYYIRLIIVGAIMEGLLLLQWEHQNIFLFFFTEWLIVSIGYRGTAPRDRNFVP